jgi:phosphate transport system substrate-binding protein
VNKRFLFASAAFLLLFAVSCQFTAFPPSMSIQSDTVPTQIDITTALITTDYPKVDGSTSTLPLQMLIACTLFDVPCDWQEDPFSASRRIGPDPLDPQGIAMFEQTGPIEHHGTHDAYMNLIAGNADVILVAREPSDDELSAAADAGITLDAVPVALDAFVFLLNTENPVDNLTLDTIRAIYTGQITTWDEVDGFISASSAPTPIVPFQRNQNSGSQELMEKLVMLGAPMIDAPDMMVPTMLGLISAVEWEPAGIGYSVYFYANFIQAAETIKLVAIEGVLPSSATITDRSYPLTTEVYAVTRAGTPPDSTAIQLRDWLLTEEGQAVVAASAYVPVQ